MGNKQRNFTCRCNECGLCFLHVRKVSFRVGTDCRQRYAERDTDYLPTPEQIEAEKALIRAEHIAEKLAAGVAEKQRRAEERRHKRRTGQ